MKAAHSDIASGQGYAPAAISAAAFLGWLLATAAVVAVAYELLKFAETGSYRLIPVGELWFETSVTSLNLMQAVVQRYLHPFLWDPIIAGVLQWPAWSLLGAPAAVLVSIESGRSK